MKEEKVFFGKDPVRLEGLFAAAGGTRGAVISHPHSLMGGDMRSPVVETVAAQDPVNPRSGGYRPREGDDRVFDGSPAVFVR